MNSFITKIGGSTENLKKKLQIIHNLITQKEPS